MQSVEAITMLSVSGETLSLSGACQEDVAASTSVRHAGLSQARRLADARPKLSGRRSSSTVVVVIVIAQQLFSYRQLSRLRKSATAAGLSHKSCTVSCDGWL